MSYNFVSSEAGDLQVSSDNVTYSGDEVRAKYLYQETKIKREGKSK